MSVRALRAVGHDGADATVVPPVVPAARADLDAVVADLAQATGAWVVVERHGRVLAHAPGLGDCPGALVEALLHRSVRPLQQAVRWTRGPRLRGALGDVPVHVAALGPAVTAWAVGSRQEPCLEGLADAVPSAPPEIVDAVVEALLRPSPSGRAPAARLVVLASDDPDQTSRRLARALGRGTARVHRLGERTLLAVEEHAGPSWYLPFSGPVTAVGTAVVPPGARDWSDTHRLADAACTHAERNGELLADVAEADVAAALLLRAAVAGAAALSGQLRYPPLARLREHDAGSGGSLLESLLFWCRSGFDVPKAAAALHVHANTLRYRLRRAGEVGKLDLTCPEQMLALQLLALAGD